MGTLQSVSNDPPAVPAEPVSAPVTAEVLPLTGPTEEPAAPVTASMPPFNFVTIASAVVILALFAWLFSYMLDTGVPSKDHWDRYLALYNSVQSIVAAAVGALLGAQVSAGKAVVARAEGAQAKQRVAKLEGNIKAFQADVAGAGDAGGRASEGATGAESGAERGGLTGRDRLLVRTMTLLH